MNDNTKGQIFLAFGSLTLVFLFGWLIGMSSGTPTPTQKSEDEMRLLAELGAMRTMYMFLVNPQLMNEVKPRDAEDWRNHLVNIVRDVRTARSLNKVVYDDMELLDQTVEYCESVLEKYEK